MEQITEEPQASATEIRSSAEDAPVVRLANAILALSVKRGASDIHLEPREKEMVVRFRIDGVLQVMQTLPKKAQMGLVSRMKILSKLDIAEKRMPQDGRISVRLENRAIDFRVSTIPSKWGEKICMRILDKSNTMLGLERLISPAGTRARGRNQPLQAEHGVGLERLISHAGTLAKVRDMVAQPYGILYVTACEIS